MHYLCTQCRKSVVIMGSDYEKIKTKETVGLGGFNYIIVFFFNSDAIFMTHWLNLSFKKNWNKKWCSFQKFRLIQSGCLSDWGSSQAFENNASNFLSFWIGKCFICERIYPWHFLTKSNRAVLKAIFITKGNSEQRSNYLCKHYLQKKIGSYSSKKITRTWIQITRHYGIWLFLKYQPSDYDGTNPNHF